MICRGPVRAVSFDMDGTLVEHVGVARAVSAFLKGKGVSVTPSDVERALLAIDRPTPEEYAPCPEEYYLELNRVILRAVGAYERGWEKELLDFWFSPGNFRVSEGAREALTLLRGAGLTLVVVSNNLRREVESVLKSLGLMEFFDAVYTPDVVGAFKPSPLVFVRVVESLGIRESELLHVGDSLEEDYRAAIAAGAQAVLLVKEPVDAPHVNSLRELAHEIIECIRRWSSG